MNHPSDTAQDISDKVIAIYRETAQDRFDHFESTTTEYFDFFIDEIIKPPARILDIGSGSGKDAAIYAAKGYTVLALEPAHELRELAKAKHKSTLITWNDDRLPGLEKTLAASQVFDHVHLNAVIFHLPPDAMPGVMINIAKLLKKDGTAYISLRHGPLGHGRPIFPITKRDILESGKGLFTLIKSSQHKDADRDHISWTRLLLKKTA
jgi:2-polyprenyl-3-methyl-5-hydroxy-6-metoxy-1,4-benzoquinol methylase